MSIGKVHRKMQVFVNLAEDYNADIALKFDQQINAL